MKTIWDISNYIYDRRITLNEAAGVCVVGGIFGNVGPKNIVTCATCLLYTSPSPRD